MNQNFDSYPISSNSRTKLNIFRFNDRPIQSPEKSPTKIQLKPGHATKENQASWLNGVVGVSSKSGKGTPSSQAKESKPTKECPQTPANRIPLEDLITSTEDAVIQDPAVDLTPEDHVIWQHVPASSNTDTKSRTPATNSKKRRHSSSPTCSPSTVNMSGGQKEPFDLQAFQALLKTPQNDIASDLWNNYVEKHKANGNGDIQIPRFESLLAASPQTPASVKTSRDSSGLKRSISCNAEWPTSSTKRQKVEGNDSKTARSLFSRTKSNVLDSGKSKPSRINFLVEQIEKSLQKPSTGPASSSPMPENKDGIRSRSSSPIERRALRASEKSHNYADAHNEPCKDQVRSHGSFSEFEDEVLDQDLLDFAAESMDPFIETKQLHDSINPANPETGNGFISKEQNLQDGPKLPATAPMAPGSGIDIPNRNDANDRSEFEDEYDSLPEHLEEIAAGYDETSSSNAPQTAEVEKLAPEPSVFDGAGASQSGNAGEASSGDEFDDEDFDLDAIEQSMKESGQDGSNHVCHS